MKDALYQRLSAASAVTQIAEHITWSKRHGLPTVTLHQVAGDQNHHMRGKGLTRALVQVDCWAADPEGADALATAVKAALDGWAEGEVHRVLLEAERTAFDLADVSPVSGSSSDFHRVSLDFEVWHHATAQ